MNHKLYSYNNFPNTSKRMMVYLRTINNRNLNRALDVTYVEEHKSCFMIRAFIKTIIHNEGIDEDSMKDYILHIYSATGKKRDKVRRMSHGKYHRVKARNSNVFAYVKRI